MFAVRRITRDELGRDEIPDPAEQYRAAFADRAAAEAHARELDRRHVAAEVPAQVPTAWNPFDLGFDGLTGLPEPVFRDWLRDRDIDPPADPGPPPPPGPKPRHYSDAEWAEQCERYAEAHRLRPWAAWWENVLCDGPDADRLRGVVWQAFDRVRFFEVVDLPGAVPAGRERVYAVVHQSWEYDDSLYCGANAVQTVYRDRAKAEAERDRLTRQGTGKDEWNGGPDDFVVVELQVEPTA